MKLLLPLLALVTISGAAFAQTESAPASTGATPTAATPTTPAVPSTPIFRDVPPNHWAFAAVQRLASAGIVQGYPSKDTVTTQMVAKLAPVQPAKAPVKTVPKVSTKTPAKKTAQK